MTKLIRKYREYKEYEPTFNSNYLFIPIYQWYKRKEKLTHINIYDITSMKIKGVVQTKNNNYKLDSCLFIKDFNILAVMYSNRLDLYDFNNLKYIGSENINYGYE